jgi:Domain of unknown function (DUF4351)
MGTQCGLWRSRLSTKRMFESFSCLLTRRIYNISSEMRSQVEARSLAQLEALGEALLDFSELSDLLDWLGANGLT